MRVWVEMIPSINVDYDLYALGGAPSSPEGIPEEVAENLVLGTYYFSVEYFSGTGTFDLTLGGYVLPSVHNINTGLNYTSIKEAIDAPQTLGGHTVFVEKGTYYEHVVVNKSLSIFGENKDSAVIDGDGYGAAFNITARDVTISEFCVRNASSMDAGSILLMTSNCTIAENRIEGSRWDSIALYDSDFCLICNNTITGSIDGIFLSSSSNNMILGNTITNITDYYEASGIWLWKSSYNNTIAENVITDCYWSGIQLSHGDPSDNTIVRNVLSNFDYYGIYIDGHNNRVSENEVSDSQYGLAVYYENHITRNRVSTSHTGIFIEAMQNRTIVSNYVTSCVYGIYVHGSHGNVFSENTVENCTRGLWMSDAADNYVYHNNFLKNTAQVFNEMSINTWDDGYPFGGNYWSDYNGNDSLNGPHQNETGFDWIGDTPYFIDDNNKDDYPLILPASTPQETLIAYRNLLTKYIELLTNFNNLNANYQQHLLNYSNLQGNYTLLQITVNNLITDFNDLRQAYNILSLDLAQNSSDLSNKYQMLNSSYMNQSASFTSLNQSYINLNQSFNDYKASTQDDLTNTKSLVYGITAIAIILAVAIVYLVVRKPRIKSEAMQSVDR
jgi:nitrous oxidase accessory protein